MRKIFIKLLILTLVVAGIYISDQLGYLETFKSIIHLKEIKEFLKPESLKTFIKSFGIWAPLIFMAIYYTLVMALFSAAIFTILAGILFGKFWGSIYVIIAATTAAQTGFIIIKKLNNHSESQQNKTSQWEKNKLIQPLIKILEKKLKKNGFRNFFILRCLFLPYMPLSYAAGFIKTAKAKDFFFATLFTNMIFSPAFVFLGDNLLAGPKALILPIILIIGVLLVPKILKKFHK